MNWFSRLFQKGRNKNKPNQNILILDALNASIETVHPDRYVDPIDAGIYIQPILVVLNRIVRTPDEYRFRAVDYECWLEAINYFQKADLIDKLTQINLADPIILSLIYAAIYDLKLKENKQKDDLKNLGYEIRESSKSLLMFLNKHSSEKSEPLRN